MFGGHGPPVKNPDLGRLYRIDRSRMCNTICPIRSYWGWVHSWAGELNWTTISFGGNKPIFWRYYLLFLMWESLSVQEGERHKAERTRYNNRYFGWRRWFPNVPIRWLTLPMMRIVGHGLCIECVSTVDSGDLFPIPHSVCHQISVEWSRVHVFSIAIVHPVNYSHIHFPYIFFSFFLSSYSSFFFVFLLSFRLCLTSFNHGLFVYNRGQINMKNNRPCYGVLNWPRSRNWFHLNCQSLSLFICSCIFVCVYVCYTSGMLI